MSGKQGRGEDGKESFKDKLKHMLGINKPNLVQSNTVRTNAREVVFTPELLKEIGPESPANNRLRTITELCSVVEKKRLEPNAVEALWQNIGDLLQPHMSRDGRQVALNFLQYLIKGQYKTLGIMRAHFFRVIKGHTVPEDLPERLDVFVTLTDNGKDLEYFEEDTGPFLLSWMQDFTNSSRMTDFLMLLINIIKYNAAHLDQDIVTGLVSNTCLVAVRTNDEEIIELCMRVLSSVICYSFLPTEALYHFIVCLCCTVNVENFCKSSWELMKRLLGTHLGHSGIYTMCCLLQNKKNAVEGNARLLRGAVFFIGMALWGSQKVSSLKFPHMTVLPSFLQALQNTEEPIVLIEVVLSVQRLISKYGKDQQSVTWDLLIDIIEKLFDHVQAAAGSNPVLEGKVHEVLTSIEQLHEQGHFHGETERIFDLIEKCASKRPETSLLVLVSYKAEAAQPGNEGWMQNLYNLIEKYFRCEKRHHIRVKVLSVLSNIVSSSKNIYEDELIETVILPHLSQVEQDDDVEARRVAAELLVDLVQTCQTSRCLDLLDIIKKIVSHPIVLPSPAPGELSKPATADIPCIDDVISAIFGLISVFKVKLFQLPSSYALRAYELLYSHLRSHYKYEHLMVKGASIRFAILHCFVSLRADRMHRLGLLGKEKESQPNFSPYALCSYRAESSDSHSVPSSPMPVTASPTPPLLFSRTTVIPFTEAFRCICQCLEVEKDWNVLCMVLEQLPRLLQNKNLILSSLPEDIERFCSRLCSMLSDRHLGLPEKLINTPAQFTKSDFHTYVFPVLTCLVSYHRYLDKARQRDLVNCLEFGLVSKCAPSVVAALQVSALEMPDVMMRQLPHVLLRLSQISATVAMAVPVLEYLSSLIRIPTLYANFVEEQYKSIFAIALPYTNPFKYSHYAVSLAYHVIAMWFLRCRLSFRRAFVGFIVKGLKSYVLRQLEESDAARLVNQDSTGRGRTSSLGDDMKRKRPQIRPRSLVTAETASKPDDVMSLFHRELTETCLDMMARYTYSNIVAMPKRSALAEYLLADGQTSSWLLGNKIITITTSTKAKASLGSLIKPLASEPTVLETSSSLEQSSTPGRRRHKSAAVGPSWSQPTTLPSKAHSKDDILLHRQSGEDERSGQTESEVTLNRLTHSDNVLSRKSVSLDVPDDHDEHTMMHGGKPSVQSMYDYLRSNWVEVHVRRPTGNIAWMMRIENQYDMVTGPPSNLLSDLSNLVMPSKQPEDIVSPARINSDCLEENEYDNLHQQHFDENASSAECQRGQNEEIKKDAKVSHEINQKETTEQCNGVEKTEVESQSSGKSGLKKSSSTPDLTDCVHEKLADGNVHSELQQAFTRSRSLKTEEKSPTSADPPKQDEVNGTKNEVETKNEVLGSQDANLTVSTDAPQVELKFRPRGTSENEDEDDGYTVSGMRPIFKYRRHKTDTSVDLDLSRIPESSATVNQNHAQGVAGGMSSLHGHINPSFVFLQLYHGANLGQGQDRPILLPPHVMAVNRAVKNLDRIYPYETQKIGVLYVGPGQATDQTAILANVYGSVRYAEFLHGIGRLLRLTDCDQETTYTGGLEQNGSDGLYAYSWHDDILQVIFHVATLMPNRESDPNCNAKKLHIGNDFVTIVYNDSGEEYKMGTIKGQFNYVNIVIQPLDHESNAVTVQAKDDIAEVIGHQDTKIISDVNLSSLVRQMALHANLASLILQRQQTNPEDPYASNWLERLRQIKRIRSKIEKENKNDNSSANSPNGEDFTEFS